MEERLRHIEDNMVTKDDLQRTRDDLQKTRDQMATGFRELKAELQALRGDIKDLPSWQMILGLLGLLVAVGFAAYNLA